MAEVLQKWDAQVWDVLFNSGISPGVFVTSGVRGTYVGVIVSSSQVPAHILVRLSWSQS